MVLCYCLAHRPLRGSLKKWGNPKVSKRISKSGAVVVVVGALFGCGFGVCEWVGPCWCVRFAGGVGICWCGEEVLDAPRSRGAKGVQTPTFVIGGNFRVLLTPSSNRVMGARCFHAWRSYNQRGEFLSGRCSWGRDPRAAAVARRSAAGRP